MGVDVLSLVAPVVQAAIRSALNSVGQLFIYCLAPLVVISSFDISPEHVAWVIPLGVALSCLVLRFGEAGPRAIAQALKFGLYVTAPAFLFTVVWQIAVIGTVGHALLVVSSAGIITMLSEFTMLLISFRSDVANRESRSATAEQEVTDDPHQDIAESNVSSVALDARLDYRYQRARDRAKNEMHRYLPTNPRTAKRMVNHISLAMAIAEERRLFDDPEIEQRHLAKWIGISEQWPALGAGLTTTPERMNDLEEARGIAELQQILDNLAPGTVASEDMLQRLDDGDRLGGVLDRLVRYEPRQLS